MKLGVHVSTSGSIDKAVDRAEKRGCETFQIFSRNPRQWKAKKLEEGEVEKFKEKVENLSIYPPVVHMPYLPNLSRPAGDTYDKSVATLASELERCRLLDIPYLVIHLGSHRGEGVESGIEQLVNALYSADRSTGDIETEVLLENSAGQANSVGSEFSEMAEIMGRFDGDLQLGACFDTCHAFAAGYDLRDSDGVERTLEEVDAHLGLSSLKVVHLNDSKGALGDGKDRHEHIGLGEIGYDGFRAFINRSELDENPGILETPIDETRDDFENLEKVRELSESHHS